MLCKQTNTKQVFGIPSRFLLCSTPQILSSLMSRSEINVYSTTQPFTVLITGHWSLALALSTYLFLSTSLSLSLSIYLYITCLANICLRYRKNNQSDMGFKGADVGFRRQIWMNPYLHPCNLYLSPSNIYLCPCTSPQYNQMYSQHYLKISN